MADNPGDDPKVPAPANAERTPPRYSVVGGVEQVTGSIAPLTDACTACHEASTLRAVARQATLELAPPEEDEEARSR